MIVVILGIIMLVTAGGISGVISSDKEKVARDSGGPWIPLLVLAAISGIIAVLDYNQVQDRVDTFTAEDGEFGSANVGAGIWCLFLSVGTLTFAAIKLRSTIPRPPTATDTTIVPRTPPPPT